MKDRYKFRAWHKGYKGKLPIQPVMLYDEKLGDCLRWKEDGQPLELMQCTTLKDKHGKLIYDKDIVRIIYTNDGFLFDGHYIVQLDYKGVTLVFDKLSWEDGSKNQFPIHPRITSQFIHNLWSEYKNITINKRFNDNEQLETNDITIIGNVYEGVIDDISNDIQKQYIKETGKPTMVNDVHTNEYIGWLEKRTMEK